MRSSRVREPIHVHCKSKWRHLDAHLFTTDCTCRIDLIHGQAGAICLIICNIDGLSFVSLFTKIRKLAAGFVRAKGSLGSPANRTKSAPQAPRLNLSSDDRGFAPFAAPPRFCVSYSFLQIWPKQLLGGQPYKGISDSPGVLQYASNTFVCFKQSHTLWAGWRGTGGAAVSWPKYSFIVFVNVLTL